MGQRKPFIRITQKAKAADWTIKQIADANDVEIIALAEWNLDDPNDLRDFKEYKRFKGGMKGLIKMRIQARRKAARKSTIIIPDATAIIMKLKAEGLTTAEAKAELLEALTEELQP
jgi:hypothetical protein